MKQINLFILVGLISLLSLAIADEIDLEDMLTEELLDEEWTQELSSEHS